MRRYKIVSLTQLINAIAINGREREDRSILAQEVLDTWAKEGWDIIQVIHSDEIWLKRDSK